MIAGDANAMNEWKCWFRERKKRGRSEEFVEVEIL